MIFNWSTDVFEIRPPTDTTGVLRYNNGLWTPDDGEWDLAFAEYRSVTVWGVHLPHYLNLQWQWLTTHWSGHVSGHPGGNAWHRATSDGKNFSKATWWKHRNQHANVQALVAGMKHVAGVQRSSSSCCAEFNPSCRFIQEGRLRLRETGELVIPSWDAACIYCGSKMEDAR